MEKTRQSNDTLIEIIDLHPLEVELIKRLRKHTRFGEVTITMRDGLPVKYVRVIEIENLTGV